MVFPYITSKSIEVVLNGHSSSSYPFNSGVPQGSVIDTTLFLIFINDLPDYILSKLAIYADNTTLYFSPDKTKNLFYRVEMAAHLKDDLRIVVEWEQKWLVISTLRKQSFSPLIDLGNLYFLFSALKSYDWKRTHRVIAYSSFRSHSFS